MLASNLLASIPSPSSGSVDIGPLTIHMYGLTLLAAIAHLHLDHRPPLGQPRRRLGSHLPLRRLGRRCRHRRRPALPPGDELGRGARPVVGAVRDLEGRPRRLGRHRGRLPRRWLHREALRRRRLAARRLPRARIARRPGGGKDRQLVEPGALRQADRPAVGPRDRPGPPAARARSIRRPTTRPSSTRRSGTSWPRSSSST